MNDLNKIYETLITELTSFKEHGSIYDNDSLELLIVPHIKYDNEGVFTATLPYESTKFFYIMLEAILHNIPYLIWQITKYEKQWDEDKYDGEMSIEAASAFISRGSNHSIGKHRNARTVMEFKFHDKQDAKHPCMNTINIAGRKGNYCDDLNWDTNSFIQPISAPQYKMKYI